MSVSTADFWKLLGQSRLLTSQQVQQLAADFGRSGNGQEAGTKKLAEWLVGKNAISRYQAAVLLAGKPGPFFFGDYKVTERLTQGRLAGCFRAVHGPTGHPVLLQFLTGAVASDPERWRMAVANTQAASEIRSPHVQRFFEVIDLQKLKFLVSEDLRGKAVDERLGAGRFPAGEACRIGRLAALGLAAMHEKGRMHGDVRPANLWLAAISGQPANVKLLFEAQQTPQPFEFSDQEAGGRLALATDYLAPELSTGGKIPDPLTDIYALGCSLYAMLTGNPPFAGGDVSQKVKRHATEAIKPLEPLGVPPALAKLVAFLMAKNPAVRIQSAAMAAEQLAAFVEPAALLMALPAPAATLASFEAQLKAQAKKVAATETKKVASAPTVPVATDKKKAASAAAGPAVSPATSASAAAAIPAAAVTAEAAASAPAAPVLPVPKRPGLSGGEIIRRQKAAQRKTMVLAMIAVVVLAIGGTIGGVVWLRYGAGTKGGAIAAAGNGANSVTPAAAGNSDSKAPPPGGETGDPEGESSVDGSGAASSAGNVGKPQIVPDDGSLLWASPTAGDSVSFRCVPPQGELFLIVRPAAMVASAEGQRVLTALGPVFAEQQQAWEATSGVKLEEVEQMIVTLHPSEGQEPRASFVVKTKEEIEKEKLLEKWGKPSAAQENSQTYYTGSSCSYFIGTAKEDERTFVMGDARDVKAVAAAAGAAPLMFRDIERLRRACDVARHCTVIFYPEFLLGESGKAIFAAARADVREGVAQLLGNNVQAVAASVHCGDEFYFELRMLPSLDKEPGELVSEIRERLNGTPQAVESYIDRLIPPQYWSRLARRYPLMVGQLQQQMRASVENDQLLVNSVLPGAAAHNLVLGGELVLATTPGAASAAAIVVAETPAGPKTIEEALAIKTTYSFDQQSLEFAMRDLAEDVNGRIKGAPFEFAIKLLGTDLEKDGITRNQSIRDFKQDNQTVADILTALVRKANPVTTVKDPSEMDQKLLWVVGPDPENAGKETVLITTRTAAGAKKYKLPEVFVSKPPSKSK